MSSFRVTSSVQINIVTVIALTVFVALSSADKQDTSIFRWPTPHQINRNMASENLNAAIAFFSAVFPQLEHQENGIRHERSVTTGSGQSITTGTTTGNGRSIITTLVATFLPMLMSQRDDHDPMNTLPFNITDLLRMVGVDSDKIGTMVINAIVYVIELVSNHFFGGSNSIEGRKLDTPGSFLLFLFDKKVADNFIERISDPEWPNTVIGQLQRATGNDTICIQQLICKMSPFWWGVNQSVRDLMPLGNKKSRSNIQKIGWTNLLKKYVPSLKEFSFNSDQCEIRFPGCNVITHPMNGQWN